MVKKTVTPTKKFIRETVQLVALATVTLVLFYAFVYVLFSLE